MHFRAERLCKSWSHCLMALARLFMFWRRRKKGRERNREDGLSGKGPRGWSEANSLAHVADVVGGKEEVLKSLVAHFEHAGEKKQQRVRHKHELEAHQREIKTHESSTQHTLRDSAARRLFSVRFDQKQRAAWSRARPPAEFRDSSAPVWKSAVWSKSFTSLSQSVQNTESSDEKLWKDEGSQRLLFPLVLSSALDVVARYVDKTLGLLILRETKTQSTKKISQTAELTRLLDGRVVRYNTLKCVLVGFPPAGWCTSTGKAPSGRTRSAATSGRGRRCSPSSSSTASRHSRVVPAPGRTRDVDSEQSSFLGAGRKVI